MLGCFNRANPTGMKAPGVQPVTKDSADETGTTSRKSSFEQNAPTLGAKKLMLERIGAILAGT
jgi:hypothetical protein